MCLEALARSLLRRETCFARTRFDLQESLCKVLAASLLALLFSYLPTIQKHAAPSQI